MLDKWRVAEVSFAGAIALFTLALCVVSYFQYNAARKAARRAMQANQIASKALIDVQRAFVYAQTMSLSNVTAPAQMIPGNPEPNKAQVIVDFQNSGDTPARAFTTSIRIASRTKFRQNCHPTSILPIPVDNKLLLPSFSHQKARNKDTSLFLSKMFRKCMLSKLVSSYGARSNSTIFLGTPMSHNTANSGWAEA